MRPTSQKAITKFEQNNRRNVYVVMNATQLDNIWERIWEKGPIGNFSCHEIWREIPFQMLQTILKYSW